MALGEKKAMKVIIAGQVAGGAPCAAQPAQAGRKGRDPDGEASRGGCEVAG
jgi:hypothetical protein